MLLIISFIGYLILIGWLTLLLLWVALWGGYPIYTLLHRICREVLDAFCLVFEAVVRKVAHLLEAFIRLLLWIDRSIISFEEMANVSYGILGTFQLAALVGFIYENLFGDWEARPMPP